MYLNMRSVQEDGCTEGVLRKMPYGSGDGPPNTPDSVEISHGTIKEQMSKLVRTLPFRPIPSENVLCRLRVFSGVGPVNGWRQ